MERIHIVIVVCAFLLSLFVAIGGFFTHQGQRDSDFRHFEQRLEADEIRFDERLDSLEDRLRTAELDMTGRLATIEVRLGAIQDYMMVISEELKAQRLEGGRVQ